MGVVSPFGEHEEEMSGLRLVHETSNCLITAHLVNKSKDIFDKNICWLILTNLGNLKRIFFT